MGAEIPRFIRCLWDNNVNGNSSENMLVLKLCGLYLGSYVYSIHTFSVEVEMFVNVVVAGPHSLIYCATALILFILENSLTAPLMSVF